MLAHRSGTVPIEGLSHAKLRPVVDMWLMGLHVTVGRCAASVLTAVTCLGYVDQRSPLRPRCPFWFGSLGCRVYQESRT